MKIFASAVGLFVCFALLVLCTAGGFLLALDRGWIVSGACSCDQCACDECDCLAPPAKPSEPPAKPPVGQSSRPLSELVDVLPEDGGKFHVTLVVGSDAASRSLLNWFAGDEQLASLKQQTMYHQYSTQDKLYRERYSRWYGGATPQVWVQTPTGKPIYRAAGFELPSSAADLAGEIAVQLEQCCPEVRPDQQPVQPGPSDQGQVPIIRPKPEVIAGDAWAWIAGGLCLVGLPALAFLLAVAVFFVFRSE